MKPKKQILIAPAEGRSQPTTTLNHQENKLTGTGTQDDPSPVVPIPDVTGWEEVLANELDNKGNNKYFVVHYKDEDPLFFHSHDTFIGYVAKRLEPFKCYRSRIFSTALKAYEEKIWYSQSIPWGLKRSMIQKVSDENRKIWNEIIAEDEKLKMW